MDENETNCDDSDPEYVPDEVDNEEEMTDQETTPESKVFNRPFYREGYSGIWQFYKKLQPLSQFSARCICCNEIKSYRTTTGNLRMHLKRKHPKAHKKLRKIDAMRRYRSISSYQTRPQSSPQTPVRDLTVWKFYDKVGPDHKKLAKCSFCFNLRSYATTVNNLKTHLAKVHCDTFTKNDELMRSIAGTDLEKIIEKYSKMDRNQRDQDMHDVTPDLSENETEDINVKNENDEDNSQPSQQPPDPTIWKFFNKTRVHADRTARCRLCNRICSYLASVYNLKLHLGKMHHALFKKDEALMQNIAGTDIEKIVEKYSKRSQTVDLYAKVHLSENAADHMNVENGDNYDDSSKSERVNRSAIWKYFTKVEPLKERGARCGLCRRVISYKSTMSNLKKHLDRHTRQEILEYRESYEKQDMWETIENGNDDDDAHNSTRESTKSNNKSSKDSTKDVVSKLFEIDHVKNVAKCKLCSVDFTSNLKHHLLQMHRGDLRTLGFTLGDENDDDSDQRKKYHNKRSRAWPYFKIVDDERSIASCNICSRELSFVSVSNLTKHLRKQHSDLEILAEFSTPSEEAKSKMQNTRNTKPIRRNRSSLWKHFDVVDSNNKLARCHYCDLKFCYKSTHNLWKHLKRKHGDVSLSLSLDGGNEDVEIEEDISPMWAYFKCLSEDLKIASCLICKKRVDYSDRKDLAKHLSKKHPAVDLDLDSKDKTKKLMITRDGDIYEIDEDVAKQEPETIDEVIDNDTDDWSYNNDETDALDTTEYLDEKIFSPQKSVQTKKRRISFQQTNSHEDKRRIADQYEKPEGEESSLDIFGKYIVSLLKKLPKQKSDQLQTDFVRQIMEAQIDTNTTVQTIVDEEVVATAPVLDI